MPGRRVAATVALATALTACVAEDALSPPPRRLVVHAVLDAGSRYQDVVLEWTPRIFYSGAPVFGASVVLTAPDSTKLIATEILGDSVNRPRYRIDLQAYGVTLQPGGTYGLRVQTADGVVATGTTTMPSASAAAVDTTTATTFRTSTDTVRLDWPRVVGARSYWVVVKAKRSAGYVQFDNIRLSTFSDTSVSITRTSKSADGSEAFPDSSTATVLVSAVDLNFYTYYHAVVDPLIGAPPSRLTGALGVFGSIVPLIARRYDVVP